MTAARAEQPKRVAAEPKQKARATMGAGVGNTHTIRHARPPWGICRAGARDPVTLHAIY